MEMQVPQDQTPTLVLNEMWAGHAYSTLTPNKCQGNPTSLVRCRAPREGSICAADFAISMGHKFQGPLNGGFQTGGFPFVLFFVILGLCSIFSGFSRFVRGISLSLSAGILPIGPFPLSRPINPSKSTSEEQSRKGPRHNLDLSRNKWETPRFGNPRFSFSQTLWAPIDLITLPFLSMIACLQKFF